jgi:CHASE2 domain-containing sensor protein
MDGSSQTGTIADKLRALGRSFESWEWSLYDETHLNGKKSPIDPDIVILGIDDASLDIENTALARRNRAIARAPTHERLAVVA